MNSIASIVKMLHAWHIQYQIRNSVFLLAFSIALISRSSANADTIAVFYALDSDLTAFSRASDANLGVRRIAGTNISSFKTGKHTVVAAKMGTGCVETARTAQTLFSAFRCDLAVSIGPAGVIVDSLPLRHWYRITAITAYQVGTAATSGFLQKQAANWIAENSSLDLKSLPKPLSAAAPAKVASGEIFVASDAERAALQSETKADLVDMNLFGLVSTCVSNAVPWLAWKIASDRADDSAPETFKAFVQQYSGEGGSALAEFVRNLPVNPSSLQNYDNIQRAIQESGGKERPPQ